MNKQNLFKASSLLLVFVVLIIGTFSFGCSSDKENVIPNPDDVASVKIATENYMLDIDNYKDLENWELTKNNGIVNILFEINDDSEMISEAVEINQKLDEANELVGMSKIPIIYKCEYTMKGGSKIYNSLRKAIDNEETIFGDFFDKIDKYAVKLLTADNFTSDEWRN